MSGGTVCPSNVGHTRPEIATPQERPMIRVSLRRARQPAPLSVAISARAAATSSLGSCGRGPTVPSRRARPRSPTPRSSAPTPGLRSLSSLSLSLSARSAAGRPRVACTRSSAPALVRTWTRMCPDSPLYVRVAMGGSSRTKAAAFSRNIGISGTGLDPHDRRSRGCRRERGRLLNVPAGAWMSIIGMVRLLHALLSVISLPVDYDGSHSQAPEGAEAHRAERRATEDDRERGDAPRLCAGSKGTAFSDVLERSGAPRGSMHHHFPDGQGPAGRGGHRAGRRACAGPSPRGPVGLPPRAVTQAFSILARRAPSDRTCAPAAPCWPSPWRPTPPDLLDEAASIFRAWRGLIAELFRRRRDGSSTPRHASRRRSWPRARARWWSVARSGAWSHSSWSPRNSSLGDDPWRTRLAGVRPRHDADLATP